MSTYFKSKVHVLAAQELHEMSRYCFDMKGIIPIQHMVMMMMIMPLISMNLNMVKIRHNTTKENVLNWKSTTIAAQQLP